jgi:hypothetical protein
MTEQANQHTEGELARYSDEALEDDTHVTSNQVSLNDYPGKAEALAEGEAARQEAKAKNEKPTKAAKPVASPPVSERKAKTE